MNNKETEGQSGPQVLTVLMSQNGVGGLVPEGGTVPYL